MATLSEKIKELRQNSGMNQVEFAAKLNISKQCVSNWENDNVMPSVEMLIRVADLFAVSTEYLLGRDEHETIDVYGLTPSQAAHIRLLVHDLKAKKN